MILADTSIWIDHLRVGDAELKLRLNTNQITVHPFIVGKIALGILRQLDLILAALRDLPKVKIANEEEVLHFIDAEALFGLGIGYVDAHLLGGNAANTRHAVVEQRQEIGCRCRSPATQR